MEKKRTEFWSVLFVLALIFLLPREGYMSTHGSIEYKGEYVKLYEGFGGRSTEGASAEEAFIKRMKESGQPLIDDVGKSLDFYLATLASKRSPYPWTAGLLKPYKEVQPIEESDENGKMLDLVKESIPAYLYNTRMSEMRMRISCRYFMPAGELMACVVGPWARSYVLKHEHYLTEWYQERTSEALQMLKSPAAGDSEDQREDILGIGSLPLDKETQKDLLEILSKLEEPRRGQLFQGLARGGYVQDPQVIEKFLRHRNPDTERAALIAFMLLADRKVMASMGASHHEELEAIRSAWLKERVKDTYEYKPQDFEKAKNQFDAFIKELNNGKPKAPDPDKEKNTVNLSLEFDPGTLKLSAVIVNNTSEPVAILDNNKLAPCFLTLIDANGKAAESFDKREEMKYRTDAESWEYRKVNPDEKFIAGSSSFEKNPYGAFNLTWGTFKFQPLKPGRYKATARLTTQGVSHGTGNAWTGEMNSDTVEITLP
ncbi:MAG: hypothetical protein V1809_04820 [Planctomycetota bacterium]